MTVVVAVKNDNDIMIGADKRATLGDMIASEDCSKILIKTVNVNNYPDMDEEQILIGFSGPTSAKEILKLFEMPIKDKRETFIEYWYKKVYSELYSYLKDFENIEEYNNGQHGITWRLLIAYKNELYIVGETLEMRKIEEDYYAVGSGSEFALGSLYTTHEDSQVTSIGYTVASAIRAAAKFDTNCNDKFSLYVIDKTGRIERMV